MRCNGVRIYKKNTISIARVLVYFIIVYRVYYVLFSYFINARDTVFNRCLCDVLSMSGVRDQKKKKVLNIRFCKT